jgi:hypothetical protein
MIIRTIPSRELVEKPSANDDLVGDKVNDAARPRLLVVGTMESLVVYGMLAYLAGLTLRSQSTRAVSVGGVALIVILIGFSRVYLGAHHVGDVAGGFAAGGAWLGAVSRMGGFAPASYGEP